MTYVIVMVIPILFGTAETRVLVGDEAFSNDGQCAKAALEMQHKDVQKRRFACIPMRWAQQS